MTTVTLLVLIASLSVAFCLRRDVVRTVNPGCNPSLCNASDVHHVVNLVHLEAVGPGDSIHAVWSTVGAPAALIARTHTGVNLSVNWDSFLGDDPVAPTNIPADISFSSKPSVAFGFVLRRLVEYDDKNDTADPDSYQRANETSGVRRVFSLDRRLWSPVNVTDDQTIVFRTSPEDDELGPSLRLEVRMSGTTTRGGSLPRLQLTPNNTHLDVFLENKTLSFNHSRFYLVVDVVNADYPMKLTQVRSIDDEYTPGVFSTYRLGAVTTADPDEGRYAAWKPVAYTTTQRTLEMQTLVKAFNDGGKVDPGIDSVKSVVSGYFGRILKDLSRQIKIGIGQEGDKFYAATNFSVWSVLVGVGRPPEDEISALVIVVIAVGLGLPAVFVVLGGVYAAVRDKKEKTTPSVVPVEATSPLLGSPAGSDSYGAVAS